MGPRPTDLSAARDFFPSGQYPGFRIPSHTQPNPIIIPFQLTGVAAPRALLLGICHDGVWLAAHDSYASDSLGTTHKGKHVLFTCLHAIAFAAFTMFINTYEVYTSVMSTLIPRHALPAPQWLREVCNLVPRSKGHGQATCKTNYNLLSVHITSSVCQSSQFCPNHRCHRKLYTALSPGSLPRFPGLRTCPFATTRRLLTARPTPGPLLLPRADSSNGEHPWWCPLLSTKALCKDLQPL